jgi:hypothetical protein
MHGYATTISKAQGASVRAIGGIVDSAATAEALNVVTSRSKEALRVLVARTALKDVGKLADHLSDGIIAKGTTQDLSPELGRYGGSQTFYAKNARAQQLSAANPARQEWEREWTARKTQRDPRAARAAIEFRGRVNAPAARRRRRRFAKDSAKPKPPSSRGTSPRYFGVWPHRCQERAEGGAAPVRPRAPTPTA